MQAGGELADLLQARGELVDRELEQRRVLLGGRADPAEAEQRRGEPLLCTIVEVALDPDSFGVGDVDQARARGAQIRIALVRTVMSRR